ncbi:CAP domain-containing protein, partial [Peptococcus simiae]
YKALEAPRKPFTADQLRMLELVNAARAEHGLQLVKLSPALCEGAEIRAREVDLSYAGESDYRQKKNNGWNPHSRLDGSDTNTLMNDLNLSQFKSYIRFNENLATAFTTNAKLQPYSEQEAFNDWMNSPGHRANILNPSNKFMGLAYSAGYKENQHWVQIFAT